MTNEIGDAPIQPQYVETMTALARALDDIFNGEERPRERHTGFVLLVFPLHTHDGRCNYISNSNREDVKTMLREQLARFEGSPDAEGHA